MTPRAARPTLAIALAAGLSEARLALIDARVVCDDIDPMAGCCLSVHLIRTALTTRVSGLHAWPARATAAVRRTTLLPALRCDDAGRHGARPSPRRAGRAVRFRQVNLGIGPLPAVRDR